jgi:protease-4
MDEERSRLTVWSFLKGLFKVVIGLSLLAQSLLFLILFVFLIGIISSVSTSLSGKREDGPSIVVPDGAALVLNPEGILVEQAPPSDAFADAFSFAMGVRSESEISVHDLVHVIRTAKDDDRIKVLVLDLQSLYIPPISASKAHYIAGEIEKFRSSGKRVIAIGDFYTQEQYLIASEADTVLMHDMGMLMIDGYGSYRQYYKTALEKLKVTSHVFRVGTFKSAIEPFIRDDMSEEAEQANRAYLEVLWRSYVSAVDSNRDINVGSLDTYVRNMPQYIQAAGGDPAEAVMQAGLIDRLANRSEQEDVIAELVGRDSKKDGNPFKGVGYRTYRLSIEGREDRDDVDNVAVITAAGPIVDGDENIGVAAGDYIADQLREARFRDDVKAVVLRVDSPGGSAFASEIIRDEVVRVKEAGKPVIVSMGSLAASGGYWISASADEIFAAPTTVTGSIGVFGYFPTFENTLAEIGVYTDGVGTTPLAAIQGAGLGPLPEAYSEIIQASVEDIYDQFLGLVAEGRGMTVERVDEIGQGRVWIGETALDLALVDRLGTIDDALAAAAERAGLEDFDVVGLTQEKSRFDVFLEQLAGGEVMADASEAERLELFGAKRMSSPAIQQIAMKVRREAQFFNSFNDPNAVYVRCIECPMP